MGVLFTKAGNYDQGIKILSYADSISDYYLCKFWLGLTYLAKNDLKNARALVK
ncbi:MAG: hypothetical protein HC906_17950 [Bacteroidales bacterium]|nr:hypothetical protein [Bacteroidales bacterium]